MARRVYQAFEGSAARDISTQRKLEQKQQKKAKAKLIKLTEKQHRKSRHERFKDLASASKVFCIGTFFVLAAATVYCQVELTELSGQISTATDTVNQLAGEQIQLEMQVSSLVDTNIVEEYARTQLGMSEINNYNVTYVNMATGDEAVVYQEDQRGIWQKIVNFFGF